MYRRPVVPSMLPLQVDPTAFDTETILLGVAINLLVSAVFAYLVYRNAKGRDSDSTVLLTVVTAGLSVLFLPLGFLFLVGYFVYGYFAFDGDDADPEYGDIDEEWS